MAIRADSAPLGDLDTLTPGMGLWLAIAGEESVTWTRPLVPQTGLAPLHEGWNLVVWGGEDGIVTRDALREIDDLASEALDANGDLLTTLTTGSPFWLNVSAAKQWWQLNEPPRIEFANDYRPEQQEELRAQVDAVVAFYVRRFGAAVPGLTVRFADAEADVVCAGYAAKVVYLKEPCIGSIAHEYGHALQEYLATREETGQWGIKENQEPSLA